MIKLSHYVIGRLADWGVRRIFMVTGGGAMHLNDSIGREPRIRYICHHHEQAASMAAECYARVTGETGVINVTTGPGGINALNGVFGAWTDSVPMLVISGQVKRETCMSLAGMNNLRQLGDQEVDIVRMAQGITKYAVLVDDPNRVDLLVLRASARWALNRKTDAATDILRALELYPNYPAALVERGRMKYTAGDKNGARADWKKAASGTGDAAEAARRNLAALDAESKAAK